MNEQYCIKPSLDNSLYDLYKKSTKLLNGSYVQCIRYAEEISQDHITWEVEYDDNYNLSVAKGMV